MNFEGFLWILQKLSFGGGGGGHMAFLATQANNLRKSNILPIHESFLPQTFPTILECEDH